MGKILYLECNSGISGDMTVGALLDLGADRDVLIKALDSLGVDGYRLHFGRTKKCGLDAYDFDVLLEDEHGRSHEDGHGHEHSHEDEHGHSHEDEHGHGHEDGDNHEHSHEDGYSHGDGYSHEHSHGDGHSHEHEHSHEDDYGHEHSHENGHEHAAAHGFENIHEHRAEHSHEHEPGYEHSHEEDHGHNHEHNTSHGSANNHSHDHRNLSDIYAIIDRLDSDTQVKDMAKQMFDVVAEAESKAHGIPVEEVHFHEVGAIDSIVDIISVAVCIYNLGLKEIVVSPLAEGFGTVRCRHGVIPVPVPATANIAAAWGLKLRFTDNEGEMVTPTGAAIAATLRTRDSLPSSCRILKTGLGAGKKNFNQANVLRAMILEETEEPGEEMWVLEANIDDCSGEALGFTMESLLEAGAADVWNTPIYMKKNRPAYMISLICRKEEVEQMEDILFIQTTTIGVRKHPVSRTILSREKRKIETDLGEAEVKVCTYKGRQFFYPEYESIRSICRQKGLDYQTVYCKIREEAEKSWNRK